MATFADKYLFSEAGEASPWTLPPTPRTGSTDSFGVGGISLALQALGGIMGASSAYDIGKADKTAYAFQAAVERNRAQVNEYQAADAVSRGQDAVNASNFKYASTEGAQRARFAAGGKALDEAGSSPYNIIADTSYFKRLDAATLTDNAAKEAWALRESAKTARSNAALLQYRSDSVSPGRNAATSLLASAGTVAANWYRLRAGKDLSF